MNAWTYLDPDQSIGIALGAALILAMIVAATMYGWLWAWPLMALATAALVCLLNGAADHHAKFTNFYNSLDTI